MDCDRPRSFADCTFCPYPAECKDRLDKCDNPARASDCVECFDPVHCRNRVVNPKWGMKEWLLLAGIVLSFILAVFIIARRYMRRTGFEKLVNR
jgi:hypothetical protein